MRKRSLTKWKCIKWAWHSREGAPSAVPFRTCITTLSSFGDPRGPRMAGGASLFRACRWMLRLLF